MSICRLLTLVSLGSLGLLADESWHGQVTVGRYSSLVYLRLGTRSCSLTVDLPLQSREPCGVNRNNDTDLWFYAFAPGQSWRGKIDGDRVDGTLTLEGAITLDGATEGRFTLRRVPEAHLTENSAPPKATTPPTPSIHEVGLKEYIALLRVAPGADIAAKVKHLDSIGLKLGADGVRDLEALAALANGTAAQQARPPDPPQDNWKTRLSRAISAISEAHLERSRREREAQEAAREVDRQTGVTWYQFNNGVTGYGETSGRTTWYSFSNGKTCIATKYGNGSYVGVNCY
jgi:hypothetical protein